MGFTKRRKRPEPHRAAAAENKLNRDIIPIRGEGGEPAPKAVNVPPKKDAPKGKGGKPKKHG